MAQLNNSSPVICRSCAEKRISADKTGQLVIDWSGAYPNDGTHCSDCDRPFGNVAPAKGGAIPEEARCQVGEFFGFGWR